MKNSEVALTIDFDELAKRQLDTICALKEHESILISLDWAVNVAESISKKQARGATSIHCLTPALGDLIQNNPKFFEALCEEGVVEWLTPLVMGKASEKG